MNKLAVLLIVLSMCFGCDYNDNGSEVVEDKITNEEISEEEEVIEEEVTEEIVYERLYSKNGQPYYPSIDPSIEIGDILSLSFRIYNPTDTIINLIMIKVWINSYYSSHEFTTQYDFFMGEEDEWIIKYGDFVIEDRLDIGIDYLFIRTCILGKESGLSGSDFDCKEYKYYYDN